MKHYLRLFLTMLLTVVWSMGGYAQTWEKVTDASTLKAGDVVTFVNEANKVALGAKKTSNFASVSVTINNATFESVTNLTELTLGVSGENWTFQTSDNYYLYTGSASSSQLKTRVKNSDGNSEATISISNGNATIKFTGTYTRNLIRYNNTGTASIFSCYSSGQNAIQLYRKAATTTPTTISFNSDFDATKTYTFTNGVAPSDYTRPMVTLSPAEATAGGSVKYTSSNTDVVDVNETTGELSFEGKTTYDTEATITAQFVASDGSAYASSNKLTYTVKNVEAKASLAFSATRVEVKEGEESSFTEPTLTLKDKDGNDVALTDILYDSTIKTVATVDDTGKVTFVAPGETEIYAVYCGNNDDYKNLNATYTLVYLEKEKVVTTLTFNEGNHKLNINEYMTVKAVLKASDSEIQGDVTYSSSNDNIAIVDEKTGEVGGVAVGTATITATFAGNSDYLSSTATYEITVVDPTMVEVPVTVFYESFDKVDNKGGNDDMWAGTGTTQISTSDWVVTTADNVGWTKSDKYVYAANKCIRLGTSSKNGNVTTPALGLEGNATLTFKAGSWGTDNAKLTLSISGDAELSETTISPTNSAFTTYTINITGATAASKITFNSTSKRVFLDEIKVSALKSMHAATFDENGTENDFTDEIAKYENEAVRATLTRTMEADGGWYTFSAPFSVADINDSPLAGAELRKYSSMSGSTMNFEATTEIKAGHAYLIKPTKNIENPVFDNVVLGIGDTKVDGENGYKFEATLGVHEMETDGTELFLGAENKFYEPTETDNTLKALRGYFVVPEGTSASKMNISIDGETTSIAGLHLNGNVSGKVYNLNGQYVGNDVKQLGKGIYVVNGKKYIVK